MFPERLEKLVPKSLPTPPSRFVPPHPLQALPKEKTSENTGTPVVPVNQRLRLFHRNSSASTTPQVDRGTGTCARCEAIRTCKICICHVNNHRFHSNPCGILIAGNHGRYDKEGPIWWGKIAEVHHIFRNGRGEVEGGRVPLPSKVYSKNKYSSETLNFSAINTLTLELKARVGQSKVYLPSCPPPKKKKTANFISEIFQPWIVTPGYSMGKTISNLPGSVSTTS